MKRLVVATRNNGKIIEINALLSGLVDQVCSAADFVDTSNETRVRVDDLENINAQVWPASGWVL